MALSKPVQNKSASLTTDQILVYDFFTVAGGTKLLYSATRWVNIKLTLQDAGPVAVGQNSTLTPVTNGIGSLLQTGVEREFILPPGQRFYIAADAINRVSVTIEPIPYMVLASL